MKCTTIKTASTITKAKSERVEELLKLINWIEVPTIESWKAGDICFYDSEKEKLTIVHFGMWSADPSAYPASRFTPIGVVVIPTSHDVYGTGECAVMSLRYMDCDNPDEGSASNVTAQWGQNGVDTSLTNMQATPYTGTCDAPGSEVVGTINHVLLPSDNCSAMACPTDPEAFYYNSSSSSHAAPSVYLADGSRNPAYYQTESPSSELNGFADFDGVGNTSVLLELATAQSDWKTADTITNDSGEGYSPAACCCWRYHTDGTAQGDWYMPALGEIGYMATRTKKINETITALRGEYGDTTGVTLPATRHGSSSENSSTTARYVWGDSAEVYYGDKTYFSVRAFLRVAQLPS